MQHRTGSRDGAVTQLSVVLATQDREVNLCVGHKTDRIIQSKLERGLVTVIPVSGRVSMLSVTHGSCSGDCTTLVLASLIDPGTVIGTPGAKGSKRHVSGKTGPMHL